MKKFLESSFSEIFIATATVTDDRGAYLEKWIAALVQTNCERQVAEKLKKASFESYVASQEEIHQWSDRKKKVNRIVIPNIVFINTRQERFDEIKHLSYIRGLLSNPGERQPAIIPEVQMQTLQFMLGQRETPVFLDNDRRHLKQGETVRVIRGFFKGMEGTVFRINSDLHVGVLISNLGFAHVSIGINDIEKI